MQAVKLCTNKILQFLTGGQGRLMQVDVYNGHKTGGLLGLGINTGSKNFLPGDFNIFMKSI